MRQVVDEFISQCPVTDWQGIVWRTHRRRYEATDYTGALIFSGRFHRSKNQFSEGPTWPAQYFSLGPEVCLGELLRRLVPETLPSLNDYRISELSIRLSVVLDCRDIETETISTEQVLHATNYALTQEIAAAAITAGAEALLIPSATRLGDNLVVFPEQLRSDSEITLIGSRDPMLYVER